MKKPLVSVITVNYKQTKVTLELLKSLSLLNYPAIETIVVDNGSEDDSIFTIKKEFPAVCLITSKKNLGFAGGNNLGIQQAQGQYFLFINNDTEVAEGFIESMLAAFEQNPQVGVVSPKIILQHPANTIQYAGAIAINPYTGRGKKLGNLERDLGQYDFIKETALAHGAAMMVRRAVVEAVGLMPELYFLYYEEHDWCEQIKRKGYKILYNGYAHILHKESISVGKNNPLKTYYMHRNRIIYCRRNSKNSFVLFVALLFYFVFALPKTVLSFLLKGKLNFAWALLKGAWSGLLHSKVQKEYLYTSQQRISFPVSA